MNPPNRPGWPHGPLPPQPTPGPRAGHDSFAGQRLTRAAALEHYDLAVLRLGGIAPPTLPRGAHTTARDSDLARVDARQRYARQLITRQQHAARLNGWAALLAGQPAPAPQYTMSQTPQDDYHRPGLAERRVTAAKIARAHAQNLADHPLEATVGEGVVIGNTIVTSSVLSEMTLLRLAGSLRWGAVARSLTVARSLSLAEGAETGMFGVRSGWQGLQQAPRLAVVRGGLDFAGQGIVNYSNSKESGLTRIADATFGINATEVGLSAYGLRPFGVALFSAGFQFTVNDGYRSVFNHRVSLRSFAAQAAIGTGVGHLGEYGGRVLGRHLAYGLYQGVAQHAGYDLGYPVWLGSKYIFKYGVPTGFGALASYYQALADKQWPGLPQQAPPPPPPQP